MWLNRTPAGRVAAKRISLHPRTKAPRTSCARPGGTSSRESILVRAARSSKRFFWSHSSGSMEKRKRYEPTKDRPIDFSTRVPNPLSPALSRHRNPPGKPRCPALSRFVPRKRIFCSLHFHPVPRSALAELHSRFATSSKPKEKRSICAKTEPCYVAGLNFQGFCGVFGESASFRLVSPAAIVTLCALLL